MYSIANFELLAGSPGFNVSGAQRDDAFSTGRRRTHTPLSGHDETKDADSSADNDERLGEAADDSSDTDSNSFVNRIR